ncbi:MAG: ATP-binding protein [Gammaproteobacteria bacterium]|nr:ATP-binding protein [Gammaproteobacteria bacterium]
MAIIMAVSLIGLGTVGSSIILNEFINLNKMQEIDLQVLADIVAETSSVYLVFNDEEGASISLAALKSKKQIIRAVLYDKNNHVFEVYSRDGVVGDVEYKQIKKEKNTTGIFSVLKDIVVDDERVGYLYLESDDSLIKEFVIDSVSGLIFIIIIGGLIAYMLASKLQKIISEPIEHLTLTALKITKQQDYNLRAEKESNDEIGILTDGFNEMLVQLQKRNSKLIESENKFREVVEQSTDALYIIGEDLKFIDVNNAACSSLGYKRNELLNMAITQVDSSYRDKKNIDKVLTRLKKERHIIVESVHYKKNNDSFPVEISFGYVNIEGNELILASARDITDRKQAQKSLQQANDFLEAKVNERTKELKEINEALEASKEKAEAANYSKSLFLANMSHEIRTPMNAVIGFTDLLATSDLNKKQVEYVESIKSGSRNLLSLINDILDLSKIEAGKMSINFDRVYIKQMLKDIYQVFSMSAKEKGLELNLYIDDSVPQGIMSDEIRLRQILFNLLNNAIKFTHKGEVNIYANYKRKSKDDVFYSLIIKVEDTGIGVRPSEHENIFNIFEQQDNQSTREFGGAGLGLAISARLAEKLGAIIKLDSEPGKGSVFELVIDSPEVIDEKTPENVLNRQDKIKFKSAKILVVDDIELNRELICEYLANQPFQLITAEDGQTAIDLVKKEKPDVVLMDIRMPVMNGIQATEIIKNDPQISRTKVIAITASAVEDKKSEKKRSLFDMVLYKPLNRKTLISSLAKFIESEVVNKEIDEEVISGSLYDEEIKSADDLLVKELLKYQQSLEMARIGGNFTGLDKLLEELKSLAARFKLAGLNEMVKELMYANQSFDIEKTQKIIGKILTGIDKLSSH